MNRYKVTKQLGDGTYGTVLKATHRQTGEVVSIAQHSRAEMAFTDFRLLFDVDGYQENEEEVLYMGGMHATQGN
jgi:protein kinase